jgi:hypothetical protein
MSKEKNSIDILLESLTDEQWRDIKLRADSNRAHQAVERYSLKRDSAIKFSEWILKYNIDNGYNIDGSPCWFDPNDKEKTYTSQELHTIYINGVWDEDEEDEDDEEELPIMDRGCCSECGEGYDNEEEWLYNTECEVCGHPIPDNLIIKKP